MNKKLRRIHLRTWSGLAVLVPAGIICGWMVIPKQVTDRLLQPPAVNPLPVVIRSAEKNNYFAAIRSNDKRSQVQLEIIQRKPSVYPSSLIYRTGGKGNELIGRIENTGAWYFTLEPDSTASYNFILYDIIHNKLIDSITFKN